MCIYIALFIITQTWKQARCPSNRWLDKLWCSYSVGYYSALKRTMLSSNCILLSKRILPEKTAFCMIPMVSYSGESKTMEKVKWSVFVKALEGGRDELRAQRILGDSETVLYNFAVL